MLAGDVHGEFRETNNFEVLHVVQHFLGEPDARLQREGRRLAGVGGDGYHHLVEHARRAAHDVGMAVGDGVESAGIEDAGHCLKSPTSIPIYTGPFVRVQTARLTRRKPTRPAWLSLRTCQPSGSAG